MASEAAREEVEEKTSAEKQSRREDDVVSIDLPAPEGWKKKFTPKKGGTPRRNEVVFISPTGEEIKNKRQLDLYLKSHSGGPSASEFDWGTGDTPRRSSRISEKSKATDTPDTQPAKKVQKTSSSKRGRARKNVAVGEDETEEDKDIGKEETKESAEVEMKDAEDVGDGEKEEVAKEETEDAEVEMQDAEDVGDGEKEEVAAEDALTGKEDTAEPVQESKLRTDEKPKNLELSDNATSGAKEGADDKTLETPAPEDNEKLAEKDETAKSEPEEKLEKDAASSAKEGVDDKTLETPAPEANAKLAEKDETAKSEPEEKLQKGAVPEVSDVKVEKETEDVKVGEEDHTEDAAKAETEVETENDDAKVEKETEKIKVGEEDHTEDAAKPATEGEAENDAVPEAAEAKVEKETKEVNVGEEDHTEETSKKAGEAEGVKPDGESPKEDQEAGKSTENKDQPEILGEAPHEPEAGKSSKNDGQPETLGEAPHEPKASEGS